MHGSLAEDHDFVARFVREARSAAQLSHPAIVASSRSGRGGRLYLSPWSTSTGRRFEMLLKKRGRLTPIEALAVVEPVLEALNAAHNAGFAHRDIKPEKRPHQHRGSRQGGGLQAGPGNRHVRDFRADAGLSSEPLPTSPLNRSNMARPTRGQTCLRWDRAVRSKWSGRHPYRQRPHVGRLPTRPRDRSGSVIDTPGDTCRRRQIRPHRHSPKLLNATPTPQISPIACAPCGPLLPGSGDCAQ